jgi:hypothetical protein
VTITITYARSIEFSSESAASAPANSTPAPAITPAPAPADRVELSSGATAQATSPAVSTAPHAGDALFGALDANKDGSITAQEFTDGATALLRRAGARHHHRHARGDDDRGHRDQEVSGSGRLERTLEKLFDRVDANHDGSIDKDELATALDPAPASPSAAAPSDQAAAAPPGNQPDLASVATTRVTYVAVAVEQYTAVGLMR